MMSETVKKDFQDAAAGFSVEIRSLYDNSTVLEVLSFTSREAFCDFLRTEKIQSGGYLDLSQKDLSGMDFSGIDGNLIVADFTWSNLTKASFKESNLIGAVFVNATLRLADFTGAETATAVVSGADMRGAEITEEQIYLTFGTPMVTKSGEFTNKKKDVDKKHGKTL